MEEVVPQNSTWSPGLVPEHRYFEAQDGIKLHYLDWPADDGVPVILMVHGRLAHAHWFDPMIRHLSPAFHCVSLDLRGHGASEASDPITNDQMASDIADFVNMFADRKTILLGHSYGGGVTALAQPLKGVRPDLYIMADTLIHWDPSEFRNRKPRTTGLKRYKTREEILDRFRLIPGGTEASPELVRYLGENSIRQLEDGDWTWRFDEKAAGHPPDGRLLKGKDIDLESIEAPSLIVYGEASLVMSDAEAEKVASRIPNAKVKVLLDGHHHISLDCPKEFARAIVDFAAEHGI